MKYYFKFILAILVIFSVLSCSRFKASRNVQKQPTQQQTEQKPEPKDQYRIAENYSGNKSQIIDLIQGPATFDIKFEGNSRFIALLMKSDGTIIDTLANMVGSFKTEKSITAPETTAYIIDVHCDGVWSIYRK